MYSPAWAAAAPSREPVPCIQGKKTSPPAGSAAGGPGPNLVCDGGPRVTASPLRGHHMMFADVNPLAALPARSSYHKMWGPVKPPNLPAPSKCDHNILSVCTARGRSGARRRATEPGDSRRAARRRTRPRSRTLHQDPPGAAAHPEGAAHKNPSPGEAEPKKSRPQGRRASPGQQRARPQSGPSPQARAGQRGARRRRSRPPPEPEGQQGRPPGRPQQAEGKGKGPQAEHPTQHGGPSEQRGRAGQGGRPAGRRRGRGPPQRGAGARRRQPGAREPTAPADGERPAQPRGANGGRQSGPEPDPRGPTRPRSTIYAGRPRPANRPRTPRPARLSATEQSEHAEPPPERRGERSEPVGEGLQGRLPPGYQPWSYAALWSARVTH